MSAGLRSQVEQRGDELLSARRSGQFQADGSLVWFDSDCELQKAATETFCVNCRCECRENLSRRVESQTQSVGQSLGVFRPPDELGEQPLAARAECVRRQRAGNGKVCHPSLVIILIPVAF